MKKTNRIKITVSNPFPIFPPTYGGQLRVYNLYLQLSRWFDINVVAYANPGVRVYRRQLAEGFFETRVPKTLEHCRNEAALIEETGVPLTDIALLKYYQYTPEYERILENSCEDSDVLICSHPYTFNAVKTVYKGRVWYDAHNVEYLLKKDMLPDGSFKEELMELISKAERECCEKSELILTCSQDDKEKLCELYKLDKGKVAVVPNGTNASEIDFLLPDERMMRGKKYTGKKSAIFVGSYHGPNLIAVDSIVEMAAELPEIQFIIVGSVGKWLEDRDVPHNILITGVLEENDKDIILSSADIALNPMTYGSGTNLKILEYFAFGIPVISTPIGVRGLNLNDKHAIVCDINDFSTAIRSLLVIDTSERDRLVKAARKFVEDNYDWKVIANRLIDELKRRKALPALEEKNYQYYDVRYNTDTEAPEKYNLRRINSRKAYIWGAGSAGRNVLKLLLNAGVYINGFIDSDPNKNGKSIEGIQIYVPNLIEGMEVNDKPFIIVASTYSEEIEKQLNCMGYRSGDDYLIQDINSAYLCMH